MILSAQSIRERCDDDYFNHVNHRLLLPFSERTEVVIAGRKFSFGLSACGYDVRIAEDVLLFPFFGRLASAIEHFWLPRNIMAEVKDKSSWARRFVTVQNTVIEPGWRGYLTLELTNHRPWPVYIRKGTPIAQIVFKFLDRETAQPYDGKYQAQEAGPQRAR